MVFGVKPAFFEEFGVCAFFDDAAFVEDDEPVHCGDGGEAVGDGDDGFAVHHFVEAFAFGGRNHFGIGRVGAAVNNVVAHGTVQQRGILRDQTDLGA